jgi:hypothetical protein
MTSSAAQSIKHSEDAQERLGEVAHSGGFCCDVAGLSRERDGGTEADRCEGCDWAWIEAPRLSRNLARRSVGLCPVGAVGQPLPGTGRATTKARGEHGPKGSESMCRGEREQYGAEHYHRDGSNRRQPAHEIPQRNTHKRCQGIGRRTTFKRRLLTTHRYLVSSSRSGRLRLRRSLQEATVVLICPLHPGVSSEKLASLGRRRRQGPADQSCRVWPSPKRSARA